MDTVLPVEAKDVRESVAEALTYLGNNQNRDGLPTLSQTGFTCDKQSGRILGWRVQRSCQGKREVLEPVHRLQAILQLRAAYLSEDDRLTRYFAQRPGNPFRRAGRQAKNSTRLGDLI